MIIIQTANSIRKSITMQANVFFVASGLLGLLIFISVSEGPFIRGILTLSVTLPCLFLGMWIWMKGKKADAELLKNRKEIAILDSNIELRKYKNGKIKTVKNIKILEIKGYRKSNPYILIKTGILSECKIVSYEFENDDIDKLLNFLEGLKHK